jgi:hypothetical protein
MINRNIHDGSTNERVPHFKVEIFGRFLAKFPEVCPGSRVLSKAPASNFKRIGTTSPPHPSALTFAHLYNINILDPQSHILTIHCLTLGGLIPATPPLRTTNRLTPTHGLLRKSSSKLHPIHKIRSSCLTAGCSLLVTTVDAIAMDPTGAGVRARRAVVEAPVEALVEAAESTET